MYMSRFGGLYAVVIKNVSIRPYKLFFVCYCYYSYVISIIILLCWNLSHIIIINIIVVIMMLLMMLWWYLLTSGGCYVPADSGGRLITVIGSYLDVVQQPIINLHDRLHTFSSNVRFNAYLYTTPTLPISTHIIPEPVEGPSVSLVGGIVRE